VRKGRRRRGLRQGAVNWPPGDKIGASVPGLPEA